MRPITKIFILLVVAFCVFLLWPRNPSLTGYDPDRLAALRVQAWKSELNGKSLGSVYKVYQIYADQYHFPPVSAFRVAQGETSAVATLRKFSSNPNRFELALPAMQEKYTLIKRQSNREMDPDASAREEIAWRSSELDGDSLQQVAGLMASLMANLYGGAQEDYLDAAWSLAGARQVLLFGAELPDGYTDPEQAAKELAADGYRSLKDAIGQDQAAVGN